MARSNSKCNPFQEIEPLARPTYFVAKTQMGQFFKQFSVFWSIFGHFLLAFHRFTGFLPILDTPRPGS